jgi:hypothetical protein
MTKHEVRKLARAKIDKGCTKQQAFIELRDLSDLPCKQVAKIVRLSPTKLSRQSYQNLNYVLMVIFAITVVLKMLYINTITVGPIVRFFTFIRPIIGMFILLGIDKYWMGCQRIAAMYTFTGTFTTINRIFDNQTSVTMYAYMTFAVITIILGLYLSSKLYPKYHFSTEKYVDNDGIELSKDVFIFKD